VIEAVLPSPSRRVRRILIRPVESTLRYQPAFDGLRGISILAVMAFHNGVLRGGYLGVDIFFTLSGFLITTLLLQEHARSGTINRTDFYARRALRLLPAATAAILVCGLATLVTIPERQRLSASLFVLAVFLYVGNWAAIRGYHQGILGHTWSLSIEEQFYLVWPPVLKRLLCVISVRTLFWGLAATAVAAIVYRLVSAASGAGGRYLYLGTDMHGDPLLIGCAAACWLSWRGRAPCTLGAVGSSRRWRVLGVAAFAVTAVSLIVVDLQAYFSYLVSTSCVAVATALVVLETFMPGSYLVRVLNVRALVWVGRRSYALYLWHYPIFILGNALWSFQMEFRPENVLPCWLASLIVADLSFRLIERPALRLKSRLRAHAPAVAIAS
jgi:peptidoglycan/LPS O-acetylase OafA/YrhL